MDIPEAPSGNSAAKFLTKRVAGQPMYVWAGGLIGGLAFGLYLRSRNKSNPQAATPEADSSGEEETVEDYPEQAYGDSGTGESYPTTSLSVPQGSTVTTDPETGVTQVDIPKSPAAVPDVSAESGGDGGGSPAPPAPPPPKPKPPSGPTLPAGYKAGSSVAGKSFPNMIGHKNLGNGSNANGNYTRHRIAFKNGKEDTYNHYTSGRLKGQWIGPYN